MNTFVPTFDIAHSGGAIETCRAMQGRPSTLDAIVAAARAAHTSAVICDAAGAPVGAVVGGEYAAAAATESYTFGQRVLHLDLGRWRITHVSGSTARLDGSPVWHVDTCTGQTDARAENLRLLTVSP